MKYLKIANSVLLWLVLGFVYFRLNGYIQYNEGVTDQLIDVVNFLQARVGRT